MSADAAFDSRNVRGTRVGPDRDLAAVGAWKNGPGTIGYAVSCGHVVCHPGDAIFGDSDGIVVVARHDLETIAAATDIRAEVRRVLGR